MITHVCLLASLSLASRYGNVLICRLCVVVQHEQERNFLGAPRDQPVCCILFVMTALNCSLLFADDGKLNKECCISGPAPSRQLCSAPPIMIAVRCLSQQACCIHRYRANARDDALDLLRGRRKASVYLRNYNLCRSLLHFLSQFMLGVIVHNAQRTFSFHYVWHCFH
jgi:hypothetical protein